MPIVGKDMNVCAVCHSFSCYVRLRYLPDPMLGSDGHYQLFDSVIGSQTSEKDRPSLQAQKQKKSLSYSSVKQHAVNVGVVIQCDECNKWRLLFSKRKACIS